MAHRPMPVIIISSLTQSGSAATIDALRAGRDRRSGQAGRTGVGRRAGHPSQAARARDSRCGAGGPGARRGACRSRLPRPPCRFDSPRRRNGIIAIGASTGGPQAIESLLTRMPAETPPIVIAQHMPAGFTRAFADRLDKVVRDSRGRSRRRGTARAGHGLRRARRASPGRAGARHQVDDGAPRRTARASSAAGGGRAVLLAGASCAACRSWRRC